MLDCNKGGGISLQTPAGELLLDAAPTLTLFDKQGKIEQRLETVKIQRPDENSIVLECAAVLPGGVKVRAVRRISVARRAGEAELVEDFSLIPDNRIAADLEVRWPFRFVVKDGPEVNAVFPTYDGYAKPYPLSEEFLRGQWPMGNEITQVLSAPLGLSAVQFGAAGRWLAAVYADPEFGAMFEISSHGGEVIGAIRYRYAAAVIPLAAGEKESRRFGLWISEEKANEEFGRSIDAFYRLMLPDAPPGPRWLHDIAMVGYDYLSDNGEGWERDVRELARLLKPEERRRVALCLHGWYDNLGEYSFDSQAKRMKPRWTAMAHTRK
ncbi:MAG: hypothetical protein GX594_06950, partial [Pirellulaceae bacterium]|nr:hypothetical protein [Pirellulaceae bacterium]